MEQHCAARQTEPVARLRRDPVVATEDTAEIAEAMPNASLITLPDASRSVLAEGGVEVLKRVTSFLADGQSD